MLADGPETMGCDPKMVPMEFLDVWKSFEAC